MGAALLKSRAVLEWKNAFEKETNIFKGEFFISTEFINSFDLTDPIITAVRKGNTKPLHTALIMAAGSGNEVRFINNLFNTSCEVNFYMRNDGIVIRAE